MFDLPTTYKNKKLQRFDLVTGTIMVHKKKKNTFRRLWACITGNSSSYCAEYKMIAYPTSFFTFKPKNWEFFTPKKEYTRKECDILLNLYPDTLEDIVVAVNTIRPNTFKPASITLESIRNNGYYKQVDAIEKY